jgi:protein TonB
MEQPLHDLRPFQASTIQAAPRRVISIGLVAALHILAIYALATGLAQNFIQKKVEEFKAEVIPPKQEVVKPPPPPPPELQKPPPPFVPPPDISIQSEAPAQNTITVSKTPPPPAAPPPKAVSPGITSPVLSAGGAGKCANSYYPPTAVRLNQEGTTTVAIHIGADGSVENVDITNSSGHDALDQAAVRCITSSWRYKPAMQNGQPVAAVKQYAIVWKLQ